MTLEHARGRIRSRERTRGGGWGRERWVGEGGLVLVVCSWLSQAGVV